MKCGVDMLTGLIRLKVGSNGSQCEHSNNEHVPYQAENFMIGSMNVCFQNAL
jgi:hypothetical protein